MAAPNPENIDDIFTDLTNGLVLDWDLNVPMSEPLELPEWRPKDGTPVRLNRRAGEALRKAIFDELDLVRIDHASVIDVTKVPEDDLNHIYTTLLLESMQKGDMPIRPGEEMALSGMALIGAGNDVEGYEPQLLTSDRTLFGTVSGVGYGRHIDAVPNDIAAYQAGSIEELPPISRTGVMLVLADVCLCDSEGYGPIKWQAEVALVPLTNMSVILASAKST